MLAQGASARETLGGRRASRASSDPNSGRTSAAQREKAAPGGRRAVSYMCGQEPEWLGLGPALPVGAVLDVEPLDPAVEPVDPVVAALAIAAPPPASKPAVANVAITAFVDRICLRFLSMSLYSALKPMSLKPRPETSENRRRASQGQEAQARTTTNS